MTLSDYVEAAILIEAANRPQEIAQGYTDWATIVANLKSLVGAQVPDEVIESLMNRFLDEGVAEVVQDQFAGDYYKLNYEQLVETRDRNLVDGSSLVFKYAVVGNQFLHNAIAKFSSDDVDISRPQLDQPEAQIPAADRIVPLNHNEPDYVSIRRELREIIEAERGINDTDISAEQRDRIKKGLAAASELWEATELKLIHVKIGVVMAIEDAKPIFKETARLSAIDALIAAIKAFIKAATGVDLENLF
ncbi:hypothetical protein [Sphingorhabdus sp.]|uniref:hypothetical protein n=1 Tax=Sphingorhabdus sp. TaxID=1902408 RepID=UPI003783857E